MNERRLHSDSALNKSAPLPHDYLTMVVEVFTTNFDAGLKALGKMKPNPRFEASGSVYSNEIVLSVSLLHEGQIAATTAHASVEFDPRANAPTVEELLAACVDAIGVCFSDILDPKRPDQLNALANESLAALENIPFHWMPYEVNNRKIFLRVDKSNPRLDHEADEWLAKNDPERVQEQKEEHQATEKLFVTGPKRKPQ